MDEQKQGGGFSIGWVLISYFLICGGVMLAWVVVGLAKVTGDWVGYAVYGVGAFIGGFFAARASPHKSMAEAAVGAVLMIATIVGLIAVTPLGPILYEHARDEAIKTALMFSGIAMVGGLGGALVGEKTGAQPSDSTLKWLGLSTLVNLGTIFAAVVVLFALLMRTVRPDADLDANTAMDADKAARAFLIALAISSFVAGVVTQAAAPTRVILGAGFGAFVALFGLVMVAVGAVAVGEGSASKADNAAIGGAAIAAGLAGIIGIVGSSLAWLVVRGSKRR